MMPLMNNNPNGQDSLIKVKVVITNSVKPEMSIDLMISEEYCKQYNHKLFIQIYWGKIGKLSKF